MTAMESTGTKEALLIAAKKVFARKGFDGATVKELADEAGVNVSLVSYHFNGKENLFRACVEEFALSRLDVTEKFLRGPESVEDMRVRLSLMAEEFFDYNLREPDLNEIMHRDCGIDNPLTSDVYQNVFVKVFAVITTFFKTAQERKILDPAVSPEDRSLLFIGGMVHAIRTEKMRKKILKQTLKEPALSERIVKSAVRMAMEGTSAP